MKQKNIYLASKGFKHINPTVCGHHICDAGYTFGPAVRKYWLIHYVMEGCGTFQANDAAYSVKKGECFVIKPYEMSLYSADYINPWQYVWVGFYTELEVPKAISEQPVFGAQKCAGLFTSLLKLEQRKEGREEYLAGKVMELFSIMSVGEGEETKPRSIAQIAKNYIEGEYMMGLKVEKIAKMLHVNRSYFSKVFKEQHGVSPKQYLDNYRMKQALRLMSEHGLTTGETAASVGYTDVFMFSRMFKRHFGMSPTAYKKQCTDTVITKGREKDEKGL